MRSHADAGMSLYGPTGGRKYLNAAERQRFIDAARQASPDVRLFCSMLRWSGGRISEVLALTPAAIDIESGVASIQTLKRRRQGVIRQVPLPGDLIKASVAFSSLAVCNAIRGLPREGFGNGAGQPRGGVSSRSWRRPESTARMPRPKGSGTDSA